jgi:hypothetical protein
MGYLYTYTYRLAIVTAPESSHCNLTAIVLIQHIVLVVLPVLYLENHF